MSLDTPIAAASPEKSPPHVSIELKQSEIDDMGDLKPGDEVRVVLVGEITSINIHEPFGDSGTDYIGNLSMESRRTKVIARNEFADLADD